MKKAIIIAAAVCLMSACSSNSNNAPNTADTVSTPSSTNMRQDSITNAGDTMHPMAAGAASAAMGEGDITMKHGKMMVMKNGQWIDLKGPATLSNGYKVMSNGDVMIKGKKYRMYEGYSARANGEMTDSSGKIMDSTTMDNWIDKGDRLVTKQGKMMMKKDSGRQ